MQRAAGDYFDAIGDRDAAIHFWQTAGVLDPKDAATARAYGLGGPCVARIGGATLEGVAEGLDPDGALRLRLNDGSLRRISAGDVFFEGL